MMAHPNWNDEQRKIAELDAEWAKAATKALAHGATEHDYKAVTEIYSKEGSVVWPGYEAGHGASQIEAHWRQANKDYGDSALQFNPKRIEIVDSLAMDFGEVVFTPQGKPADNAYKYFVVWRRENGAWKVYYDCWNANRPDG